MATLGDSLYPIALTHAHDSTNPAHLQPLGERQIVNILPQVRRPFTLTRLPGWQPFLASKWGTRLRQWRRNHTLLPLFKNICPDLIHFHWIGLAISLRWIPETLGVPYTVSLRGSEVRVLPRDSAEKIEQIQETLENASGIHTVCQDLGQNLEHYPFRELATTHIYTCVPIPDQLPPYPAIRDTLQFFSAGRLHWTKGYPDLLLALKKLQLHHVPYKLTLAGHGPDEDRLRFWISRLGLQEQVRLLGKVSPSTVETLMRSSHAYVQSSLSEGLSNSLAEAMANGCPVLATKVGGTTEVVQDRRNGILLNPMEPDTWIESLKLVRNTSLMLKIRQAAHDTAQKCFSSTNHIEQFLTFYKNALSAYQSRLQPGCKPYQKAQHTDGRKKILTERANKILLLGDWEWPIGVDAVLRITSRIIQALPHGIKCKVVGSGSQREELHYLCNFMNVLQYVELVEVGRHNKDQISKIQEEWGNFIINCHRHGEISVKYEGKKLVVRNLQELENTLLSFFGLDKKFSDSTSVGITQNS